MAASVSDIERFERAGFECEHTEGFRDDYVVTLRHPIPAAISTYEKSTGLPGNGRFSVRGNIENWAHRDVLATGEDPEEIFKRDYFDVYLRYWEQYHYHLALSGLFAGRNREIVNV